MSPEIAVVILAGGEGSRLGGGKPLRILGGERLIDRAVRQARMWSATLAVAVRDAAQVRGCKVEMIQDREDVEGPLGGLASALQFAIARECELLLIIPADMPFLPDDLLNRRQRLSFEPINGPAVPCRDVRSRGRILRVQTW